LLLFVIDKFNHPMLEGKPPVIQWWMTDNQSRTSPTWRIAVQAKSFWKHGAGGGGRRKGKEAVSGNKTFNVATAGQISAS